jgi:hypothetical protein
MATFCVYSFMALWPTFFTRVASSPPLSPQQAYQDTATCTVLYHIAPLPFSLVYSMLFSIFGKGGHKVSLTGSCKIVFCAYSGCQCQSRNSPGFDPSILRHSGIRGVADEAALKNVHKKKQSKSCHFLTKLMSCVQCDRG